MVKEAIIMGGHYSAEHLDCKYVVLSVNRTNGKLSYEFVENLVFDSPEDAESYYADLEGDCPSEDPTSLCLFKIYADTVMVMQDGKVFSDVF